MLKRQRWVQLRSACGLFALLAVGCASPGVPRAPSLHLPTPVRDLSAQRTGPSVQLRFTAPDESTDHQALVRKGVPARMTAVVCRMEGSICQPVARMPTLPGELLTATDTLPLPLTVGPGRSVAYRVRVENAEGRSAGESREALAAAGQAPAAVSGLAATTVPQGIQITWRAAPGGEAPVRMNASLEQTNAAGSTKVTGPTNAAGPPEAAGSPDAVQRSPRHGAGASRLLQTPRAEHDPGGAIDTAPAVGDHVTYQVYRQRDVLVNGQVLALRGDAVTLTAVRSADVFAPAAPVGLLLVPFSAAGGGSFVSLSWEPNSDADLAGYYVYRSVAGGEFLSVSAKPVRGISYEDRTVPPGSHVRYAVSAVDRAGNESARSAAVEADVQ